MMDALRENWVPIAILTGLGIFIWAPLLFFGMAFSGEEQIGFYYPLAGYVQEALRHGTSFMWNSSNYGGVVTNLDQFASVWNPINRLLLFVLPFFLAQHIALTIGTTGGLLLTYWFGRVQGWGKVASLVFALAYVLATGISWLDLGTLSAWQFAITPALFLAVWYAQYSRNRSMHILSVALGGVAVAAGFLMGYPQLMFYFLPAAGLYALCLDSEGWKQKFRVRSISTALAFVAMVGIGMLLSFPQWLPSALLLNFTTRTGTFAMQSATHQNVTEFIAFVLPPYFQIPFFNGGSSAGFYVGPLFLIMAVFALVLYRSRSVYFFAVLYALYAAFAFHLPGFSWINEHVPPFSHMSGNFRYMVAAAWPLAFLAGAGTNGFLRTGAYVSIKVRRWCAFVCSAIAAILLAGSVALQMVARSITQSPESLQRLIAWYTRGRHLAQSDQYYQGVLVHTIDTVAALFSLTNPLFLFGVLSWIVASIFFFFLKYNSVRLRASKIFAAYSILLVIVMGIAEWKTFVPQSIYAQEPAIISFLKSHESNQHSYRILGFIVSDGLFRDVYADYTPTMLESAAIGRETLVHATNMLYGIEQMNGMKAFRTLRINRLLGTVINPEEAAYVFDPASSALATSDLSGVVNRDVEKQVPIDEKIVDFEKKIPLLSMMNVKYLYTPYELHSPDLKLVDTIALPVGTSSASLYVYQNKSVLPRLYFARSVQFVEGRDADLLLHLLQVRDFAKTTLIECNDCANSQSGGVGEIHVHSYENGKIDLTETSSKPEWLVFSESSMPGWHAYVDGREVSTHTANYLFQAIQVPAGEHQVFFVYRDVGVLELWASLTHAR